MFIFWMHPKSFKAILIHFSVKMGGGGSSYEPRTEQQP